MIVLMAGLPGTGKTTLARELAGRTGGRVVSKDDVRHALFSVEEIEYSPRQDDFCLQIMLRDGGISFVAESRRGMMFLDGRPFSRRYQIENVLNAADRCVSLGGYWNAFARRKQLGDGLQADAATGAHAAGNRDFQLYLEVKARFEAITFDKTVIDTDRSLDSCVEQALAGFTLSLKQAL